MSLVVPSHRLNKYGGVFTTELRDDRRRKSRKKTLRGEETAAYGPTNIDIGQGSVQPNPALSSPEIQQNIYKSLFKTY